MDTQSIIRYILILMIVIAVQSCRKDDVIVIPDSVPVSEPQYTSISGFYLLNEGNMGMNKCTLDYYDYTTGTYTRNIYGNANPSVPKELGDVGNDIAIYGSRLYAVINASNKIEVMNANDATRIGQIDVPNCRYIKFYEGYAYVTSYAGPIEIDHNYAQKGYVAKIDTATMKVVAKCTVGYQPDGIEIMNGKIYVANSGGYLVPNYENTIYEIDITSFSVVNKIPIAINLHQLAGDSHGGLWILSRGDYKSTSAALYCYDVRKQRVEKEFDIPASNICLVGDSLYVIGSQWNELTQSVSKSFPIIDVNKKEIVTQNFIIGDSGDAMQRPYGIAVNPLNRDIMVTDARSYVSPGYIYYYDKDGNQKWKFRTGDIPAHFVFKGKSTLKNK